MAERENITTPRLYGVKLSKLPNQCVLLELEFVPAPPASPESRQSLQVGMTDAQATQLAEHLIFAAKAPYLPRA